MLSLEIPISGSVIFFLPTMKKTFFPLIGNTSSSSLITDKRSIPILSMSILGSLISGILSKFGRIEPSRTNTFTFCIKIESGS